jgi:hypothetical protein
MPGTWVTTHWPESVGVWSIHRLFDVFGKTGHLIPVARQPLSGGNDIPHKAGVTESTLFKGNTLLNQVRPRLCCKGRVRRAIEIIHNSLIFPDNCFVIRVGYFINRVVNRYWPVNE